MNNGGIGEIKRNPTTYKKFEKKAKNKVSKYLIKKKLFSSSNFWKCKSHNKNKYEMVEINKNL